MHPPKKKKKARFMPTPVGNSPEYEI